MTNLKDKTPLVDILLSTYNGSSYLEDLLKSIKAQTHNNWRLLIRDDGSNDNTVEIIKAFSSENIIFLKDEKQRLGPCQSFAEISARSIADYVMFCDQDDVWLNEKIELTLKKMREAESKHGNAPVLVYTDMKVVDKDLKIVSQSFWRHQYLNPAFNALNHLLLMNVAAGCTMMMNKKLAALAFPIPRNIKLHDWWVALTASALGRIEYVNAPTMLYRQHGENITGTQTYPIGYIIAKSASLAKTKEILTSAVEQGKAFLAAYKDKLSGKDRLTVESFSRLLDMGRVKRLRTLFKFNFTAFGFIRNAGISVLFFLMKRTGK